MIKKASPRNLLDNSDFRNPVNQRGYKKYTSATNPETNADPNTCYNLQSGTTIDRWFMWSESGETTVSVNDGYITFSASYHGTLNQRFPKGILNPSKSYTFVVKKPNEPPSVIYPAYIVYDWSVADTLPLADIRNGTTVNLEWIALYEGEYTAETIPEYQPKGYENELLVCSQYDGENYIGLRKFRYAHNLLDNSDFRNPVNQRGQTSYNASGYAIDRWRMSTWSGNPVTITADGLVIGGNTDFLQYIEDAGMTGKIYTVVTKCNGEIVCGSGIMPTSVGSVNYVVDRNEYNLRLSRFENGRCGVDIFSTPDHSNTFEWVALYEGEYTIDTLPEYQPKGYGAELAECLRYYQHNTSGLFVSAGQYLYVTLQFPMRIIPTITATSKNGVSCSVTEASKNGFIFINSENATSQMTFEVSADL